MTAQEVPVVAWVDKRAIAAVGCGHECFLYPDGPEEGAETALVLATDYAALLAEHEALLARVEAAECDAERYRWLRAENAGTHPKLPHDRLHVRITYPSKNERGFTGLMVTPAIDELDAAIDAARQGA